MSKQDRQGVRTASDLERKYRLGSIEENEKAERQNSDKISNTNQAMSQFMAEVNRKVNDMSEKVDDSNKQTEENAKAVEAVKKDLSDTSAKVDDMKKKVDNLEPSKSVSSDDGKSYTLGKDDTGAYITYKII